MRRTEHRRPVDRVLAGLAISAIACFALAGFWPTPLPVSLGGTGASSFTAHRYIVGEGTSPFVAVPCPAGDVLVGQGVSIDPACVPLSGDVSCTSGGVCSLPGIDTAANYPLPTSLTTDANGRITAVTDGDVSIFGDGSMGAYTLDGTVAAGTCMSKAGSIYTMTCNVAATNVTISGAATLVTAGYQLFVSGTLDLTGASADAINWNGNTGGSGSAATTAGSGGTALTGNTVGGSATGGNGGAGAASVPSGGSTPGALAVGAGGTGGSGSAGANAGGSVGVGGSITAAVVLGSATTNVLRGATLASAGAAGGGGGGGKGNGATAGGGGGGGGSAAGVVWVSAFTLKLSGGTSPLFAAIGGTGGAGGTSATASCGGGGAGGGGGGGYIYLIYAILSSGGSSNDLNASGGVGGQGGGAATSGFEANGANGGSGGAITIINMTSNSSTQVAAGATGGTGNAGSGTTGGTGGTGGASVSTL